MPNVEVGSPGKTFNVTAAISAASAAVSASVGADANAIFVVTHFSGSCDITCLFTIESPSGTVIWRKRVTRAAGTGVEISENFDPGLLIGTKNQAVVFKGAAAATNTAEVNGNGYRVLSG